MQLRYGILDRYIGKSVLLTILLVALILTLVASLITFVDQTRFIGRGDMDFWFLCKYLMLEIPGIAVLFFPVAVLIGGVVALGNLARTSELVIIEAAGVSRTGVVMSALKSLFPLIVIVVIIGETIVPRLDQYAEDLFNRTSSQGQISITHSGLWVREDNVFVAAQYSMSDGSLHNIVRYDFDGEKLISSYRAKEAHYTDGAWTVSPVVKTRYTDDRVQVQKLKQDRWNLRLNPDRLDVVVGYNLTFNGLLNYIHYLEENNQDSSSYRLQLYSKFVSPFSMVIMLLLAASTVFGSQRSLSMGARVLVGIALGFAYYVANQVGSPFALMYGLPPVICAVLPSLLFLILCFKYMTKI